MTLTMNDAAVHTLGLLAGLGGAAPQGGLAPGLRARLATGISRRGEVLVWADSAADAAGAPSFFPDLTAWECGDSSFHLEDHVPVDVATVDGEPRIAEDGQRLLLLHGVALALEFGRLVHGLARPCPVRCVTGANETNATFRFHRIRPGESWHHPDLDGYQDSKLVVADFAPAPA